MSVEEVDIGTGGVGMVVCSINADAGAVLWTFPPSHRWVNDPRLRDGGIERHRVAPGTGIRPPLTSRSAG